MQNQTKVQERIYRKRMNFSGESFFGDRISGYLIRKFRKNYLNFPLLDAGAGDGSFIKKLRSKGYKVDKIFGVDLVEVPELNIVRGDLKALSFSDDFFQTIVCTEVLEHLDNETLEGAFREFKRTLKTGGHLIATFPFNEDLERNSFACPNCERKFHRYGHERAFKSKENIREIFSRGGFDIVYLDVLPLGAIAAFPPLRLVKFFLNKLNNPPGFRKRAIVVASSNKTN